MRTLAWRYVSNANVFNTFFYAYADKVIIQYFILPINQTFIF